MISLREIYAKSPVMFVNGDYRDRFEYMLGVADDAYEALLGKTIPPNANHEMILTELYRELFLLAHIKIIYLNSCTHGHVFQTIQAIADLPVRQCPQCGRSVSRSVRRIHE